MLRASKFLIQKRNMGSWAKLVKDNEKALTAAADKIKKADSILITAGAGMSVDSGLPDFRGDNGFWNAFPPLKHLNIRFAQMANPTWFYENPRLAWGFYGYRQAMYRNAKPHEGYQIVHSWLDRKPLKGFVYTSNVDGQFLASGIPSDSIVEAHGSVHFLQCQSPKTCPHHPTVIVPANNVDIKVNIADLLADPASIPRCPGNHEGGEQCKLIARPNVLMFNDWDWSDDRTLEQNERFNKYIHQLQLHKARLLVIEIGAGGSVPTIRNLGERMMRDLNAELIRINLRESQVYGNQGISLALPAKAAITAINNVLNGKKIETSL